jgi:hypothetical protein
MAAGDQSFDGGLTGCGCSRFVATGTYKQWQGNALALFDDGLSSVRRVLYFRQRRNELTRFTDAEIIAAGGAVVPSGHEHFDAYPDAVTQQITIDCTPEGYGTRTETEDNPFNIFGGGNVSEFRLRLSDFAVPADYTIQVRDPLPPVISYVTATKYSIRFRDSRMGYESPIPVGPFGVNGGGDFPRHTDLTFTDEFTESEFADVLETFLEDPLFPTARETVADAFPSCDVDRQNLTWSGQGHASRMFANHVVARPAIIALLGHAEASRGHGILRKSTIYVPGAHSLKGYPSRHEAGTPLAGTPLYSPSPGAGVGGVFNGVTVGVSGNLSPIHYSGTPGCENILVECFTPYAIPVPDENYNIDWRENESCPP